VGFLFTALCVAILVWAEFAEQRAIKIASKTAASSGFIAVALALGLPFRGPAQQAIFVGLIFGMAGDLFLLSRQKRYFLLGLGSFLLNHVAFVVGFVLLGVDASLTAAAALPLGLLAVAVWRWLSPHVGSLRAPVLAYIGIISAMVASAVGAVPTVGSTLLIAAILFFTSDLCVARDRFISPGPINRLFGLPLYYGGQLLFAWGVHAL